MDTSSTLDETSINESTLFWKNKYLELKRTVAAMRKSTPEKEKELQELAQNVSNDVLIVSEQARQCTNPFLQNCNENSSDNQTNNSPAILSGKDFPADTSTFSTALNCTLHPLAQQELKSLNNVTTSGFNNDYLNNFSAAPQYGYTFFQSLPPTANDSTEFSKQIFFPRKNFNNGKKRRSKGGKRHNSNKSKGNYTAASKSKGTSTVASILNKMIEDSDSFESHEEPERKF